MKVLVKKGTTSYIARIFLQDSTVTTGAGKTGLTSGSAGLICYRARDDDGNAGGTQLSLSAGTKGTWSSGGFVEKDSTNMPGVYELGLDNNGLVTGSHSVLYMITATGVAPCPLEIQLVNFDPEDGVHLGLTSLPNTAVTTNASLLTSGTGTDQLHVAGGIADANAKQLLGGTIPAPNVTGVPLVDLKYTLGTISPAAAGSVSPDWGQVVNKTTTNALTGTTIATSQVVASVTGAVGSVTGSVGSISGVTFPTNFASLVIDVSGRIDVGKILGTTSAGAAGYVGVDWGHVNAPTTTVALTGTTIATSQVVASVSGAVGSVTGAVGSVTGNVGGNVVGTVASVVGDVAGNVDGSVGSVVGDVTVGTNEDKTGYTLAGDIPVNYSAR